MRTLDLREKKNSLHVILTAEKKNASLLPKFNMEVSRKGKSGRRKNCPVGPDELKGSTEG